MTYEVTLTGPDGANPLGFLCALGTVRTLTNAWPEAEVKLSWRQLGAHWRPVLRASRPDLIDKDALVNALYAELKKMDGHPAWHWDDTHNIPMAEYRAFVLKTVVDLTTADRRHADWASALACDALADDKGFVDDTAFRTMSGQGHQHFLKQMRLLQQALQRAHMAEALFGWRYQDEKLNLRYDPAEDRRHALRWKSPDKDPIKTVWGANRLAVEGLVLHPAFPVNNKLETTGFSGHLKDDTFWTWPVWSGFLGVDVIRSVLALSDLQSETPNHARLAAIGIRDAYRSQRILAGKFRAFTPAQPI